MTSLRILAGGLMLSSVLIGAALYVVVDGLGDYPSTPVALGLSAVVAIALVLAEAVGFRAKEPVPEPDPAARGQQELQQYLTAMSLRFAITEAPIIIALAMTFTLDGGMWPYVITTVPALAVMAFEIWPTRRNIEKYARAVEADGRSSQLRELLLPGR
jgi:hypothetical protein